MKKAYVILGLLIILSQTGYSQVDLSSIEMHVARYTTSIDFEKLNRDTITTFSYLVLYDEQSRLDTIILSSMLDSTVVSKSSIDKLKTKYEKLPSQVPNLTNIGIFVPVLLMPHDTYYKVFMDDKGRSNAHNAWTNLFSIQDPHIAEKYIQYTIPAVLTLFPAME